MMSGTFFKYYNVHLTNDLAISLGYESKNIVNKFDYQTKKKGIVCVKVSCPESDSGTYKISYSFCSPADNFSKAIARKIANGRNSISIKSEERLTAGAVAEIAINTLHVSAKGGHKAKYNSRYDSVIVSIPDWFSKSDRMNIIPNKKR